IHHRHQAAVKHFFCPSKFCNARARQDPVAQDSIRQAPSPTSTTTDGSPAVSASPCDGRAGLPCAASGSCLPRAVDYGGGLTLRAHFQPMARARKRAVEVAIEVVLDGLAHV